MTSIAMQKKKQKITPLIWIPADLHLTTLEDVIVRFSVQFTQFDSIDRRRIEPYHIAISSVL